MADERPSDRLRRRGVAKNPKNRNHRINKELRCFSLALDMGALDLVAGVVPIDGHDGMEDRNTRTTDALTLDVDVPAQG